ncbi:MAG: SLC13 family permease, partial [Acidimicrobiales bacterium]
ALQNWSAFVLVTGLLLLGLVARADGLFDAGGELVARSARGGPSLLVSGAVLVAVVTAVLNLDTAVAFLTPVLIVAARRRRTDETAFLYLAIFLANGASLLLPGSNLTNLIVLGHRHVSGTVFAATMLPAWVAASVSITVVVAVAFWTRLVRSGPRRRGPLDARLGAGLVGGVVAVAAMLTLSGGVVALVVAGTGIVLSALELGRHRVTWGEIRRTVDVALLAGLFGLAVALGTLGRSWSGPATILSHLNAWGTAVAAAASSVLVNNLPAASLLAARRPPHPFALLIGLNVGPNLFVTGSLAWILWLRAARAAGGRPDVRRASVLGLISVPFAMAAAVGVLVLSGAS